MRSIWTGSLTFGLVNIPVKLYSATQENRPDLDMLHKTDMSPIRFARVCKHDGKEVTYDEIVKGYEVSDGEYVILTDEDFEKANAKKTNSIEILSFSDIEQIDTKYYEKPYYIEPDKGAGKAYALLCSALKKSNKVGVTKFVLRNREHLALVKPEGNMLCLVQMRFADEVREPAGLKIPDSEVSDKEVNMALALIDQLSEDFDITGYKDTYTDELHRIIDAKAEGRTPAPKGEAPKPTAQVKDLLSLLSASLDKGKGGGTKTKAKSKKSEEDEAPADKSAARKRRTAARKRAS